MQKREPTGEARPEASPSLRKASDSCFRIIEHDGKRFYIPRPVPNSLLWRAYGRKTDANGTVYLFDRAYLVFARRLPGQLPELWDRHPDTMVEEVVFGTRAEKTGPGTPSNPWSDTPRGCWITPTPKRAPRRRKAPVRKEAA
jgi:hypothetical protein